MNKGFDYGFWEVDNKHLDRLYAKQEQGDLLRISSEIAREIDLGLEGRVNPHWLDIGSGDGLALYRILRHMISSRFNLSCIEPNKIAISKLKERLSSDKRFYLQIFNSRFSPDLIPESSFNILTLLHSVYYLGKNEEDYIGLFETLYTGLKTPGRIISQSVSSTGDFNKLGIPTYSDISLGNNLYNLLKKNGYNPQLRELRTRYDATEFIRNPEETVEDLKKFYQFINQDPNIEWNCKIAEGFKRVIKDLALNENGKLMLDFRDTILILEK